MKVKELRSYLKERGVKGYSTMRKEELKEQVDKLKAAELTRKYEEDLRKGVVCRACLEQQRIQRKIDEKMFYQQLLDITMRELVCRYCRHTDLAVDGDLTVCVKCGAVQDPAVHYFRC